jgi:hypothetical protein
MSESIFYKTSGSNYLSPRVSSLSKSTSALFDKVCDSTDPKSPQFSSSKSVGMSSPNSLFNRLKKESRSGARRQSSSIFNVVNRSKIVSQNFLSLNFNQMPSKGIDLEVIQPKRVSADVEAKPWTTRTKNKETVSSSVII